MSLAGEILRGLSLKSILATFAFRLRPKTYRLQDLCYQKTLPKRAWYLKVRTHEASNHGDMSQWHDPAANPTVCTKEKLCRGDKISSPQLVTWVRVDLNSCNKSQGQKCVPATFPSVWTVHATSFIDRVLGQPITDCHLIPNSYPPPPMSDH